MKCRRLEADEWDEFDHMVDSSQWGAVLQTSAWGKLKHHTGWEPQIFVVTDDDQILAGAMVLLREMPGIAAPIMYSPRGPVADPEAASPLKSLTDGVREFGEERGAVLWKVDPAWEVSEAGETGGHGALSALGFRRQPTGDDFGGVQPRFVMRMPVAGRSRDDILMDMHSKTRYNIRLAKRRGVEVIEGTTLEDVDTFYRLLEITSERNDFGVRGQPYFENLYQEVISSGWGKLFLARYEDEMIAGTIGLRTSRCVWYLYGASANRHRNVMPNYALQWSMILWAKEEGCEVYDLRGVSGDLDPDNPLYGLYRFKKGFGAELVELVGEFDLVLRPVLYRLYRSAEPIYRSLQSMLGDLREGSG